MRSRRRSPLGRVMGLFGPSASGKSTLIRAIAGVQSAVSGKLIVLGEKPGSVAVWRSLLMCGLLVARQRMPSALHAISDAMPLSYAVDGMHHLTRQVGASGAGWGDLAIVLVFAVGALVIGAATLRRRTGEVHRAGAHTPGVDCIVLLTTRARAGIAAATTSDVRKATRSRQELLGAGPTRMTPCVVSCTDSP